MSDELNPGWLQVDMEKARERMQERRRAAWRAHVTMAARRLLDDMERMPQEFRAECEREVCAALGVER